jgi:NAD(P)-dependent dehydrogenase (short-subunit alcohol dehydrogenase family)
MSGKRIFITGGASGFGRALAERYAQAGWSVLIGDIDQARNTETLAVLQGKAPRAHAVVCDVRKEEDLQAAADWLVREWGGVDVVVNNAGVAVAGGIADQSMDDWRWVVDINLLGVVRGCKVFTPVFRKNGSGYFVNVASAAGLIHPPLMAAYNATKAAVVAISETLAVELDADNIGVSVVCPSFFRTNLHETARATTPELQRTTRGMIDRAKSSAEDVAEITFNGVRKREFRIIPHNDAKIAFGFKRSVPFSVFKGMLLREAKRQMAKA